MAAAVADLGVRKSVDGVTVSAEKTFALRATAYSGEPGSQPAARMVGWLFADVRDGVLNGDICCVQVCFNCSGAIMPAFAMAYGVNE